MKPARRLSVRRRLLAVGAGLAILAAGPGVAGSTFSAFVGTTANGSNSFTATYWVPPSVTGSVIVSLYNGSPLATSGYVHQGGGYEVLANVSDPAPSPGVASVTADASQMTTGQTAATLTYSSGGVTIGSTTYHYVSAQLTANSTLSGTKSHTVTAVDNVGNSSGAVNFASSAVVDNTAPSTPSISTVSTPIGGTISLSGTTGTDATAGVAGELFQISPHGANTWSTACRATGSGSVSCSYNTASVTDGSYDFRGLTLDNAGNLSNASGAQSGKVIDNTAPTVTALSITPATGNLKDSATFSATGTDGGSGMSVVDYQVSPTGAGTWTTLCSKSGAGGSVVCSLDNTAFFPTDDTNYDFRALAVDKVGNSTASATVTRYVDNSPFATNIQAVNGTGTSNVPDVGDVITFSYSEQLKPSSVDPGWDGSLKSTGISTLILQEGSNDQLLIYDGVTALNIGTAFTGGDYLSGGSNGSAYVAWSASSIRESGSQIIVTMGGTPTFGNGATAVKAGGSGRMTLTMVASATDMSGQAGLTTITATQPGSALDF